MKWYVYHDVPGPESPFPPPPPSLRVALHASVAEIASLRSTGRLHCFRVAPSRTSFFSNSGSIRIPLSSHRILLAALGSLGEAIFAFRDAAIIQFALRLATTCNLFAPDARHSGARLALHLINDARDIPQPHGRHADSPETKFGSFNPVTLSMKNAAPSACGRAHNKGRASKLNSGG